MPEYQFFHPIEVRYGDLDPQGHVNNSRYLTYMEQARIEYIHHLGLWGGGSFMDLGVILADLHIIFHAAVLYGQEVRVGVRVTHLGNKSLKMEHSIQDTQTGQEMAWGESVLVAYDYHQAATVPVPEEWRKAISAFEGWSQA